nr:SGNH/GDSL hydrolase family protein [Desulfobacula sp.]
MKKVIKSFLICMLVIIAILILTETGFRLLGTKPSGTPPYSVNFSSPDQLIGFRCYPNSRWFYDTTPSGKRVERIFGSTDNKGYRPLVNNSACNNCRTIVVLGDSISFGVESSNDTTWPEALSKELSSHGYPYKVRNISFRGWGTIQESLALEEYVQEGGKADYVIYLTVANDPIDNISLVYGMPAPIIEMDVPNLQLVEPKFNDEFLKMSQKWKLEKIVRRSAMASYFYKLGGAPLPSEWDPLPIISMDKNAYRAFWPSGTTFIESFLESMYAENDRAELAQKAFAYGLKRMKQTTESAGAKLIVIPSPFGPLNRKHSASFKELLGLSDEQFDSFQAKWISFNNAVKQESKKAGVMYLDVFPAFENMEYHQYVAAPSDWHYSSEANAMLGKYLSDLMLDKNLIPVDITEKE